METKRATVYFGPELHKALRLKAVATECVSIVYSIQDNELTV